MITKLCWKAKKPAICLAVDPGWVRAPGSDQVFPRWDVSNETHLGDEAEMKLREL